MSRADPYDHEEKIELFACTHFADKCWCDTVHQPQDTDERVKCGRCAFLAFCEEMVSHWRGEDYEDLFAEVREAHDKNSELNRLNYLLHERVQDTKSMRNREGVRAAAQVPLLWGRGDYSLGYSISQHILALIDEQNPLWGFNVLRKEKIEELIETNGYVGFGHRFTPRPRYLRLLWNDLKRYFGHRT